jgi:hypothetical protein
MPDDLLARVHAPTNRSDQVTAVHRTSHRSSCGGGTSRQVTPQGIRRCVHPPPRPDLPVDRRDMPLHGPRTQTERCCDLPDRHTTREAAQHLNLAHSQPIVW